MSEITRDALEYAVELHEMARETITSESGKEYYDANAHSYRELEPKRYPAALNLRTLASLVDYLKSGLDELKKQQLIVLVEDPTTVCVYSENDELENRTKLVEVVATLPHITLEQFMPQEAFIIQAQAGFVANEDRASMINFASHLEIKEGSEVVDNGVSQVATVKNGVASLAKGIVPNPIQLAPYRTFTEVVQPESQFVFRINGRAQLALFEADGGAWTLEAVNNVAAYLKDKLGEQEHLTILA
ncbi:TPA: hypothetical protein TX926_000568 [Streptococcus suis]|nr:hypothetical protein [Streptococcus suis]